MAEMTITEALAEIKTIDKRILKKREFVLTYLTRQEMMRDPHDKDGGSVAAIERERQAIGDLLERKVALRRAIQAANAATEVTVLDETRTIADWLVWRRDTAPTVQLMLVEIRTKIDAARGEALRKGVAVHSAVTVVTGDSAKPTDLIVNINEQEFANQVEAFEEKLGRLDGQLSLKNATVLIDV